ncbi:phosphoglycerate kinase [Jannaschia aquimarina]|uniref:Phosphoglycerate kinase n=1 Tax=Jannaschia aquimarina TaxID=935700 RepID=A0A0D1EI92_9RHOB|nr:phosphoglycerate kinase [Jannaschia aquimarina]KIT17309.1 Phosphoglycerate kinase [Jannaschia aquimarina]SNT20054.1 phosphoglycerate kinase [Jannaschia aquimarina]
MAFRTLDDMEVAGKAVLTRVDLNVPVKDGRVSDTTRIERVAPTIRELSDKGAKVVLLAHFGRPKGKVVPEMSLRQIVPAVAEVLGRDVAFADSNYGQAVADMPDSSVILFENVRFNPGEEQNDPGFAERLASVGDLYCNDAFSAAHRAHATTEGLAHHLPAFAGRAMQAELEALEKALGTPTPPVAAVVGGAKVSTKLDLLGNLVSKVQHLIIGGGMANTFLAAQGFDVAKSLCEHDLADTAREIVAKAEAAGCTILLPRDVVVAETFEADPPTRTVKVEDVPEGWMILDAGPDSVAHIRTVLDGCATLVWNGPLGAFEMTPFDRATVEAARHAAELTRAGKLVSVAGGGDTVAALNQAGVADDFTYISTAGGAFLEWMEGKKLPGVAALEG